MSTPECRVKTCRTLIVRNHFLCSEHRERVPRDLMARYYEAEHDAGWLTASKETKKKLTALHNECIKEASKKSGVTV